MTQSAHVRSPAQIDRGHTSTPFRGCTVIDDRGSALGTVAAAVFEDGDHDPSWLVVDTRWRRRLYVPVDGMYPTNKGELVVPFDRAWVKAAPRAGSDDQVLTYETRRELATHYGDAYDWWPRRSAGAGLAIA